MILNEAMSFLREDEARTERWAHLTEGLDKYQRSIAETLMDNAQALTQGNLSGAKLDEATTTGDIAAFNRVAYPLIRRIYPELVANQLVSIQPMTMPVTLVFFLDLVYGTDIAPTAAGDRNDWEGGKFNKLYASGAVRGEALGTGTAATTETDFQTDWYPIRAGSETVYIDAATTAAYTIDYATGAVTLDADLADGAVLTIDYNLVMEGLGSAGNAEIPEIELEMSSAQVGAESKKLKAKWTIEAQQDLQAIHGLSAESELVKGLGREIRHEIDRMVIDDLYENASAGNVTWDSTLPADTKIQDHNETLVHAFGDVSTEIYKKRLRRANFVVMGPDTLNILDKTNAFRLTAGATGEGGLPTAAIASGANVVGTLSNRYNVVVDPQFPTNKVLVGHKGEDWTDTGYVYAPYVGFQTQTFIDPKDMTPRKGLMTRFGRHLVNGDYYGTVTIA